MEPARLGIFRDEGGLAAELPRPGRNEQSSTSPAKSPRDGPFKLRTPPMYRTCPGTDIERLCHTAIELFDSRVLMQPPEPPGTLQRQEQALDTDRSTGRWAMFRNLGNVGSNSSNVSMT